MEKTLTQTQESEKPYRNIIEPSFSDLDPSLGDHSIF